MAITRTYYHGFQHPGTTVTIPSVVVPAGALVLVAVCIRDPTTIPADAVVSNVKWDVASPQNLTMLSPRVLDDSIVGEVWAITNPTAGTDDIVVTISESNNFGVEVVVLAGINTTTPHDGLVTAQGLTGTAISVSIATQTGDLIVAFPMMRSTTPTMTVTSPSTEVDRVESAAAVAAGVRVAVWERTGNGTLAVDGVRSTSGVWVIMGVNVNLAAITGTAGSTLGALASAASGNTTVTGSATSRIGPLASAASGNTAVTGAATSALGGLKSAGAGSGSLGSITSTATSALGGLKSAASQGVTLSFGVYEGSVVAGNTVTVQNVVVGVGDVLRVHINIRDITVPSNVMVTSVSYNTSEALTEIAGSRVTGAELVANLWALDTPSVGEHDVVASWDEAQNATVMVAVIRASDPALPTDPVVTATANVSTAPTVSVTTETGDKILAFVADRNTTHTLAVTSPSSELDRVVSNNGPAGVRAALWTRSGNGTLAVAGTRSDVGTWIMHGFNVNVAGALGTVTSAGASTMGGLKSAGAGSGSLGSITSTATSTLGGLKSAGTVGTALGTVTSTATSALGGLQSVGAGQGALAPVTGTATSALGGLKSTGTVNSTLTSVTSVSLQTLGGLKSAGTINNALAPVVGVGASTLGALRSTGAVNSTLGTVTSTGASALGGLASHGAGIVTAAPPAGYEYLITDLSGARFRLEEIGADG